MRLRLAATIRLLALVSSLVSSLALSLASLLAPAPAQAATYEDYKVAVLQGLDKVTGRVARLSVPVNSNGGTSVAFGDLTVIARACRKTPPEELPEAVAYLEIDAPADTTASAAAKAAQKQQNKLQRWYSGWMFASDPSLATLEHPVYDINVVDCEQPVNPEQPGDAQPAALAAPASNAATSAPVTSAAPVMPAPGAPAPATDEPVPEDTDAE